MMRRIWIVATLLAAGSATPAMADIVQEDDVIVTGPLIAPGRICVGNGCSDGEIFPGVSFEGVIKMNAINSIVVFEDASSPTGSFPRRDWAIQLNESSGGAAGEAFIIQDQTAGTNPFRINGTAPENALFVADDGKIGLSTNLPQEEIHIVAGVDPGIRFESTNGGTYAWDLTGNSINFFLQDVNEGTFPIIVRNGAPTGALTLRETGRIGLGTTDPQGTLDIDSGGESSNILFTNTSGAWKFNHNVNTGRFTIGRDGGTTPFKMEPGSANNLLRLGFGGNNLVEVNGNLEISGECEENDGACADYVFGPDHDRLSLPDLRAFISENKHLPNVPTEAYIRANGVNVAHFSGRILEKVEELTLYTLEQQELIVAQQDVIANLIVRLTDIEAQIAD